MKSEEVFGGDTVRYAMLRKIKKQLDFAFKEIVYFQISDNRQGLLFKLKSFVLLPHLGTPSHPGGQYPQQDRLRCPAVLSWTTYCLPNTKLTGLGHTGYLRKVRKYAQKNKKDAFNLS